MATKWQEGRVRRAIEMARRTKSPILHLGWTGLDAIPKAVWQLHELEDLRLEGNHIESLPPELGRLPQLKRVDIRCNPIREIASHPGLILDGEALMRHGYRIDATHVVGVRLDTLTPLTFVRELPNLKLVDFSVPVGHPFSQIELTTALALLSDLAPHLEELSLWYCDLEQLPDSIKSFTRLKKLELSGNHLTSLPDHLGHLQDLESLSADDNNILSLPGWLGGLKRLRTLTLRYNDIAKISTEIGNLASLRFLDLGDNNLRSLPPSLGRLLSLEALRIDGNLFPKIPNSVFALTALQFLKCADSQGPNAHWSRGRRKIRNCKPSRAALREIGPGILRLAFLKELNVIGQPVQFPPQEVVNQGLDAIKDYWRQREESGTDHLCEAKLLIVGEAGAGKTSLARKILDPNYQLASGEKSTEGIDVLPWQFPTTLRPKDAPDGRALNRNFQVNIWDFGGQEIYHATHQFFLTRRSVYVLVADSRKEDTDLNYWLSVVELLSDGSPLLIVKNEKQDRYRDIDEQGLRARFPNLREVLATNLDGNRGLDEVVRRIRHHLEGLGHIGDPLPATWKRVREALERDSRDHISLDEYLRICETNGFKRHNDKLQLSAYLHDLGICLHFQDDPVLKNTVILKPKWGTDAVYRVLDRRAVSENRGRFTETDLASIWAEDSYAPMRHELLHLMMRFKLCYKLNGTDAFIAPQLLGSERPGYAWDERGNLAVKYRYEFMPKGIVTRLIVGLHKLIEDPSRVWRSGVVLAREGSRCEVIEDYPRRAIAVRASGVFPRELLAIVDNELMEIHDSFRRRLQFQTLVPCRCPVCVQRSEPHLFDYRTLVEFARDNERIQCLASRKMVDARDLVASVLPERATRAVRRGDIDATVEVAVCGDDMAPPATKEVFVSYKWEGESERVVAALEKALGGHGIRLIRDRDELAYKDSIQGFMQRISRGSCIVVVLSREYFTSKSCMFELTEIAARGELRDRVFPVILPDTSIIESKRTLEYAAFWEKEIQDLDAAMKRVEQSDLDGVRDDIDLFRRIRAMMPGIAKVLRNMNARTISSHEAAGFRDVVAAVKRRLDVVSSTET